MQPPHKLAATRGPTSLRLSVTPRCQLHCAYCRPDETDDGHGPLLPFEHALQLVRVLRDRFGLAEVHVTGGEPLLRENLAGLIAMLAAEGVPDIALTTNGQLLAEQAAALTAAGLRRVNVSLDSLDAAAYARLTGGGQLARTLRGLRAARRAGLHPVRLNVTVLRGINDREPPDLAAFALAEGHQVRFLELMPLGPAAADFERRFVPSADVAELLAERFELHPLPAAPASSARWFLAADADGRSGRVGFISPTSQPFCAGCGRLRLTASGRLVGCLRLGQGPDIRSLLARSGDGTADLLAEAVGEALGLKDPGGRFVSANPMAATGG